MANKTYEQNVRGVYVGLVILAVVTLVEVLVSLIGKGHIGGGIENKWILSIISLIIILLSLYKARFIIFEFMHLGGEVPTLAKTVLLPTLLLVWGLIAFLWEGNYWKNSRADIQKRNEIQIDSNQNIQGSHIRPWDKQELF